MRMKFALCVGIALLAVAAVAPTHAQSMKIGVFDPQRVSEETAQGKRLQAKLSALQQQKRSELQIKQQELADLEKQFNEQRISLSPQKGMEMQKEIEVRKLALDNAGNLAQQELQIEFAGAQQEFNGMLLQGIEAFGKAEGFDLILDMAAVAYMAQSVDVTTAIIDHIDQIFPVTDAPAAATPGN